MYLGITWLLKECCRDCSLSLGLHSTSGQLQVLQSRHHGSAAKQAGTQAAAGHGGCSSMRVPSSDGHAGRTWTGGGCCQEAHAGPRLYRVPSMGELVLEIVQVL